jgi:hypothetical protein
VGRRSRAGVGNEKRTCEGSARSADVTLAAYLDRLAADTLAALSKPPAGSFASQVAHALVTTLSNGMRTIALRLLRDRRLTIEDVARLLG